LPQFLVQGATYGEIGRQRKTSERTVANQAQSIYRKLGIGSRTELSGLMRKAASTSSFPQRMTSHA
jgi:DNA-binding NarL/FixJ family response regulator